MLSKPRAPRQRDAPRAGAVLAPARPPTRQRGLRASAIPARAGATFAPACAKARWWSSVLARPISRWWSCVLARPISRRRTDPQLLCQLLYGWPLRLRRVAFATISLLY